MSTSSPKRKADVKAAARRWQLNNAEKNREKARRWYLRNPSRAKEVALQSGIRKYGLTIGQYGALLAAQGGTCAICPRKPAKKRLAIDHDHNTGEVRGLLCHRCNLALGNFGDDPKIVGRARAYLLRGVQKRLTIRTKKG